MSGNQRDEKKLTLNEFCDKRGLDASLSASKEMYDEYVFRWNQRNVSISDLKKERKMPGPLHD